MNTNEFAKMFGEATVSGGDPLIMVINKENGELFSVKGITPEFHEDADGSTTLWIEVEDF